MQVCDASPAACSTDTVAPTVTAVNDAATAQDEDYSIGQDISLTVTVQGMLKNDGDVDGDALTAVLAGGPPAAQGSLAFKANDTFTFTPPAPSPAQ